MAFTKAPQLFELEIVYSYVIEVANSESDLSLQSNAQVSEIFGFYHLLKNAIRQPKCRGHVHLGNSQNILRILRGFEDFAGFGG